MEFHRWKGERLKEHRRISVRLRRWVRIMWRVTFGLLVTAVFLAMVWVMSGHRIG